MAFDYKTFATEIGMTGDDISALDGLFSKYPTAATKIDGFLATQVEARIAPLRTQLEDKQRQVDAEFETLATVRAGDSDRFDAAQKRIEKLESESAVLRSRIQKVATDAGITDVDQYLKDLSPDPHKEPEKTPTGDPMDSTKLMQAVGRQTWNAFEQSALLQDIADEHKELFGKPLSRAELVTALQETARRTNNPNLTLHEVWESKFGVAARREELRETAVQARIADEVKKAETRVRDELALKTGGAPQEVAFTGSPFMAPLLKDQQARVIPGQNDAVRDAIAEYNKLQAARRAS